MISLVILLPIAPGGAVGGVLDEVAPFARVARIFHLATRTSPRGTEASQKLKPGWDCSQPGFLRAARICARCANPHRVGGASRAVLAMVAGVAAFAASTLFFGSVGLRPLLKSAFVSPCLLLMRSSWSCVDCGIQRAWLLPALSRKIALAHLAKSNWTSFSASPSPTGPKK